MWIVRATVVTPAGMLADGAVEIGYDARGWGRITAVAPTPATLPPDAPVIDAAGLILAPGFIDLQLNGAFGHDFTQRPEMIWSVAAQLPRYGVTSFLPTIITSPAVTARQAQQVLLAGPPPGFTGAQPLGLHIEGPFLNRGKKGAHNPAHLRAPDLAYVRDWSPQTAVALVTLAPELPGATAVIHHLAQQGVVVSAGHSLATYAQAVHGFNAGIRYGTHLFNAMLSLHHREPGLAGALLGDGRATIGLIPDGLHVHPALVKLVWQTAGARLNLVTDAMAALGAAPGAYQLGDFTVTVDETSARLADGTLAGSILSLDAALRNFIQFTGCTLAEALATITTTPAQLLGLAGRKGHIAPGCDADLVLLTPDLQVVKTFVNGRSAECGARNEEYHTNKLTN
ncbi:MAG: N-acetylglucosamine-6-phosphate deacetylase [Anaerolinea sp.]|nr:N-acetylglucosamine-6-phosphate deacetylase [Anaerolinea sp.]